MKRFASSREAFPKQSHDSLWSYTGKGICMLRPLIVSAFLVTVAVVGIYTLTDSITAARDSKAATFSERFAPVLKPS